MHFVNAKGILSQSGGMNLYRGCTHGCIYCDSRSTCYQFTHDFEDIEVKQNAPELLRDALTRRRQPCMIGTGAMCDPYMHCEKDLCLTRQCLQIICDLGFGAAVQTKSDLVLRDLDLFAEISSRTKAVLEMTLTTYDEQLCKILEPHVCTTARRYDVLCRFRSAGVPTVVWMTPFLPFINDTEENLRGLLDYCFDAGVRGILTFGFGLTLREGDREYFYAALDRHFPGLKRKYHTTFGYAYDIPSPNRDRLYRIFDEECERHGVLYRPDEIFHYLHEFPKNADQMTLF